MKPKPRSFFFFGYQAATASGYLTRQMLLRTTASLLMMQKCSIVFSRLNLGRGLRNAAKTAKKGSLCRRERQVNITKKPEITFTRGNCGRLWGCKDGKLNGPIVTMGDTIFERERRKKWISRNKQESCEMNHKCFQDFINCHE